MCIVLIISIHYKTANPSHARGMSVFRTDRRRICLTLCLCFEEKVTWSACKKDMKRKSARLGMSRGTRDGAGVLTIIIPALRTHHESFRDKLQMRRGETPRHDQWGGFHSE